jgi:pimeloyl-ACP methyl ester carboxylesterase
MPSYVLAAQWLLDRGFAVVLPLRPGHGETAGPYFEDQGRCDDPDYLQAGLRTAESIAAAIDYLSAQPFVRKSGVLVLGQSAGGWGGIALASRNPAAVRAVIAFAGGRGGHADDVPNNNCASERLVDAAGVFGQTARIPTLWLYAENDSYFAPALSRRMYAAFGGARDMGGRVEYHLLPAFGPEGHMLLDSDAAFGLWEPVVERFLAAHP